MIRVLVPVLALAGIAFPSSAMAGDVKVHASGAIAVALDALRGDYQTRSGDTLAIKIDRSADIGPAVAAGEATDVVIAEAKVIDGLVASGHALPGSVVPLAASPICVVVPANRPAPKIDTSAEVRRALLAARSVGYSNSLSGDYVTRTMFPKLGITRQMARVARQVGIAKATVAGDVDIAFSQCSEMLHIRGLTVVGPLPPALQHRSILTAFVGARAPNPEAGARLLRYLTSPAAVLPLRNSGLVPLSAQTSPAR
ncbi:molybdate transport system substrate-binding protein [Sphingomonas sp. PvP055]|uniref:substrate-binding domain-containing protein n=1 Tax=Sphingomonas sp. PvP055 TaxID=3156391 RepID=UPI00339753E7